MSHTDDIEVVLIYQTDDIDKVESCIKLALKDSQYRKRKEFYEINIDILKNVINLCGELSLMAKKKSKTKDSNMFLMLGQ